MATLIIGQAPDIPHQARPAFLLSGVVLPSWTVILVVSFCGIPKLEIQNPELSNPEHTVTCRFEAILLLSARAQHRNDLQFLSPLVSFLPPPLFSPHSPLWLRRLAHGSGHFQLLYLLRIPRAGLVLLACFSLQLSVRVPTSRAQCH